MRSTFTRLWFIHFHHVHSLIASLLFITCFGVASHSAMAQDKTVKGSVKDASSGEALIGVSVVIQGTSQGTVTDVNGDYRVQVSSPDDVLVFSFIGYQTVNERVGERNTINLEMQVDTKQLSEVVVTALGVERESKSLGYTVQKVSGEEITQARETNVINALAGKVAGVNIVGSSSGPTASSNITIRGQSSLSGNNQPLFVVNGLPITNGLNSPGDGLNGSTTIDFGNAASLINPDDIAEISVLKGPTAAALYGTRAANGVVLITTKTGKDAEGFGVEINSNTSFQSVLRWPDYQNSYGGGGYGKRDYVNGTQYTGSYDAFGESWGPPMDGRLVRQFGSEGEPVPFNPSPDNIKNFFRTGRTFTNNVALNYHKDEADFRLSYTNLDQQGVVPNSDLSRNTFFTSAGTRIAEKLSVRGNMFYIDGQSGNVPNAGYDESSSIMYGWLWYPRNLPISKLEDYWEVEDVQQRNHESLWTNNPYFLVNENTNSYQRRRFIGNVNLIYDITDNLKARFRTSGDVNNESRQFRRAVSTRGTPEEQGSYREDELYFRETNHELLITYSGGEISENLFTYEVSVGGNRMKQISSTTRNYAPGLTIPGLFNLGNARGNIITNQFDQEKQINSIFGLANIAYQNMIFLDLTARNDWSSTLPINNNSYFYPSVSLSAVISDLFDISPSSPIAFAKIRAGYAQVGGDTDPYNIANVYEFGNIWGGQPVANKSALLRNPDLKPETTSTFELGTDIRFFDDRLGIDFTYYYISSRDQILQVPLAQTTGYAARLLNAGEIQNKGVELMLRATPLETNAGLNWDVSLNFARNRSEVISLADGITNYQIAPDMYPGDGGQDLSLEARVGEPMGQLVGLDLQRVQEGPYAGEVIHQNGIPLVNTEKVSAGTYQPDFTFGLYNTFNYKNFSFGFLFDGRVGGKIFSRTHTMLVSGGAITNEDDEKIGSILEGRVEHEPLQYDAEGNPPLDENGNYVWGPFVDEGSFVGPGVMNVGTEENPEYVPNDEPVATRDYIYRYYNNIFNRDIITTGTFENTWVKLREVIISYNLPASFTDRIGLQAASVSLVGRNLLLFTDVPTIDPEAFSIRDGRIIQGFESTQLPSTRSFGFNISIRL
ncbi:TonB-linked SusC/RagA family outer membrane protein [Catalinimonas alkaloidigena]|uniref:SusC/RagA family TonB-linked outer membrane protein n=1 Tax=Catalinimonas alkaloidigena TaxID=1075417 RepID=UPI0024072961|nr:SusC/RagA family TonB-linked outer membrane protein [Catalinimonas alkaloidigena]MDF9796613.1 TonB-linked SusC/RagA family outer membrane protein [Catalinimonas alkaloidigena]